MKSRVVLIHIGNYPPEHFWRNIEHLSIQHPDIGIDLILDSETTVETEGQIRVFNYEPDSRFLEIIDRQQIDSTFRNGFWRYSTERLFALAAHAIANPEYSYIHIESDVLILPQFPFDKFQELSNISWSRYDNDRDLASIVFIPGLEESEWFLETMCEIMSERTDLNDMVLLNLIAHQFPERIRILPTSSDENSELICGRYASTQLEKLTISQNYHQFSGVFDSAAIGIWLTGTEPRNYYGLKKKFSTLELLRTPTYIDPSRVEFTYREGEGLFFTEGENKIPVFNLHIHSKDLDLFGPNWEVKLNRLAVQSKGNRVRNEFSFSILLQLILENFKKGSLLSFILWVPGIREIRKLRTLKILKFLR